MSIIGVPVAVAVPNGPEFYSSGDYTAVRLYKATSQTATATLLTTFTLDVTTTRFDYQDTAGLSTDWYEWCYYSVANGESQRSPRWPAWGLPYYTRASLRQQVAKYLGMYGCPDAEYTMPTAFASTSGGTSTTVISSPFVSSRDAGNMWQDWFLYITASSTSSIVGTWRRVASFSGSTFTVTPAFAATVPTASTFELLSILDPNDWHDCVNRGTKNVWGRGIGYLAGEASQTEYDAPFWIERADQIKRIQVRSGSTLQQMTYLYPGKDFEPVENEGGSVTVRIASGLSANAVYVLEAIRNPATLTSDTDSIGLSDGWRNLYIVSAAVEVLDTIAKTVFGGVAEDKNSWRARCSAEEMKRRQMLRQMNPNPVIGPLRRSNMTTVSGRG